MNPSKKPHTKIKDLLRGKQSGFALPLVILIAVVLIVAGGVGYYFYLSRDEVLRDKISKEQKEQAVDEATDWKTYRDEEYGFEVRYPNGWKFEGKIGAPPSPTFIYRYGEKSYCRFDVVVTNTDNDGGISAFRNEGYSERKITIGGISAIRLSESPVGMNLESRDYVYFNKGLNYYRITRMSFQDANEEKCLKTFNQILSTFKFIK